MDDAEKRHILQALDSSKWVVGGPSGAAAMLGMKRSTLQSRMQKLGISRRYVGDDRNFSAEKSALHTVTR
jgi:formate hydrogenlyase transcriptional activator